MYFVVWVLIVLFWFDKSWSLLTILLILLLIWASLFHVLLIHILVSRIAALIVVVSRLILVVLRWILLILLSHHTHLLLSLRCTISLLITIHLVLLLLHILHIYLTNYITINFYKKFTLKDCALIHILSFFLILWWRNQYLTCHPIQFQMLTWSKQ